MPKADDHGPSVTRHLSFYNAQLFRLLPYSIVHKAIPTRSAAASASLLATWVRQENRLSRGYRPLFIEACDG